LRRITLVSIAKVIIGLHFVKLVSHSVAMLGLVFLGSLQI